MALELQKKISHICDTFCLVMVELACMKEKCEGGWGSAVHNNNVKDNKTAW